MPKNIRIEVDYLYPPQPPQVQRDDRARRALAGLGIQKSPLPTMYMPSMPVYMPYIPVAIPESPKPSKPTATMHDVSLARALKRFCERRTQEDVAEMLNCEARSVRRWIKSAKFSKKHHAAVIQLLRKVDN